jgi:hypothetical protein
LLQHRISVLGMWKWGAYILHCRVGQQHRAECRESSYNGDSCYGSPYTCRFSTGLGMTLLIMLVSGVILLFRVTCFAKNWMKMF